MTGFRYYLPALLWFVLCCVLFTLPGSAFPKEDWLDLIWFDKWVHIGLISILVLLPCFGRRFSTRQSLTLTYILLFVLLGSLYGVVMEYVQLYFVANRSFDGGDIVADIIGALLGGAFAYWRWGKK